MLGASASLQLASRAPLRLHRVELCMQAMQAALSLAFSKAASAVGALLRRKQYERSLQTRTPLLLIKALRQGA